MAFDATIYPKTLGEAVSYFFHRHQPQFIVAAAAVAVAVRAGLGDWTVWDAAIVGAIFAWWPIQEWLIHVYILHMKPRKILGRWTFDPEVASKHRRHHRDPLNLVNLFIPWKALVGGVLFHYLFWPNVLPTPALGFTAVAAYLVFTLHYEWSHYICHTPYVPKGGYYRKIWQNHRLHHFKNEHYWMGVSMLMGDRLLGTHPRKEDVETSPTARTLGVEETLGVAA